MCSFVSCGMCVIHLEYSSRGRGERLLTTLSEPSASLSLLLKKVKTGPKRKHYASKYHSIWCETFSFLTFATCFTCSSSCLHTGGDCPLCYLPSCSFQSLLSLPGNDMQSLDAFYLKAIKSEPQVGSHWQQLCRLSKYLLWLSTCKINCKRCPIELFWF